MAQASVAGSEAGSGGASLRAKVQRFGSYLSGMVMPNIGAFIAWGLITALFIPDEWLPNATLAALAQYATIAEDHPLVDLVVERPDRIRE